MMPPNASGSPDPLDLHERLVSRRQTCRTARHDDIMLLWFVCGFFSAGSSEAIARKATWPCDRIVAGERLCITVEGEIDHR